MEANRREITLSDVDQKVFDVFVKWVNTGCPDWQNIDEAENGAWMDPKTGMLLYRPEEDMPEHYKASGEYIYMLVGVPGSYERPSDCRMCQIFSLERTDDELHVEPASSVDVFIFADKYDIPIFRLEALIALQLHDEVYSASAQPANIVQAYDSLAPTSTLGRYLVQHFIRTWIFAAQHCDKQHRWNSDLSEHLPRAFMFNVMALACDSYFADRQGQYYHEISDCWAKPASAEHGEGGSCRSCRSWSQSCKEDSVLKWCNLHDHKDDNEEEDCCQLRARSGTFGDGKVEIGRGQLYHCFERRKEYFCDDCFELEWPTGDEKVWCIPRHKDEERWREMESYGGNEGRKAAAKEKKAMRDAERRAKKQESMETKAEMMRRFVYN